MQPQEWLIQGAEGWLRLVEEMTEAGLPTGPRWLPELERLMNRINKLLSEQEAIYEWALRGANGWVGRLEEFHARGDVFSREALEQLQVIHARLAQVLHRQQAIQEEGTP